MVSHSSWFWILWCYFCLKQHPSVSLAFIPVGWQEQGAANTQNHKCLCTARAGGDFIVSWAFHIHRVGTGALDHVLLLMFPLLLFWRRMKVILCKRHLIGRFSLLEMLIFPTFFMFYCTYTQISPLNTEHKYMLALCPDFWNAKVNWWMALTIWYIRHCKIY